MHLCHQRKHNSEEVGSVLKPKNLDVASKPIRSIKIRASGDSRSNAVRASGDSRSNAVRASQNSSATVSSAVQMFSEV